MSVRGVDVGAWRRIMYSWDLARPVPHPPFPFPLPFLPPPYLPPTLSFSLFPCSLALHNNHTPLHRSP